jgi:acyl-CoA thioesterase-2|tara:strand:+ start:93605 stop:94459 length:855 start_codon:yes stop_codon:yes gene_type:complete
MENAKKKLLSNLKLEEIDQNLYKADSLEPGWQRIFGGLIVAQSVVAAYKTIDNLTLHSLHSYFIQPGNPLIPIIFKVENLKDGRSFSTRNISAFQNNKIIFFMSASFHKKENGYSYQDPMPKNIKGPNNLLNEDQLIEKMIKKGLPENIKTIWDRNRPIEYRPVSPRNLYNLRVKKPKQYTWMKFKEKLPKSIALHHAILSYASDYTLLDTALMPHKLSVFNKDVMVASLDHSLWIHRDFKADEWLLYIQNSPLAFGGRAIAKGAIYTQDGLLVASVAQEGIIR